MDRLGYISSDVHESTVSCCSVYYSCTLTVSHTVQCSGHTDREVGIKTIIKITLLIVIILTRSCEKYTIICVLLV